jgi:structural maintenance of chromosome 2
MLRIRTLLNNALSPFYFETQEGMFNNANVIFRTKFVDGVSTVTRTIGTGSSRSRALASSNTIDDQEETAAVKGARTGGGRRRGKENA